ncbi:MAG: helix-turn-helix domain-containing protein [Clostridia bacterium]|nr:helix-turn-helix domain-containing protein [Clostridia bacterium]
MKKTRCSAPTYTREYTDWSSVPAVMSVEDLCCLMHITEQTAFKMLSEKKIPAEKVGREWRIDKEAVRSYLNGGVRNDGVSVLPYVQMIAEKFEQYFGGKETATGGRPA